jgi:Zn-finger nucleic acid-binding protein
MIDVCPTCNGVWLDNGELEMLGSVTHAEYEKLVKSLSRA